MWKKNIIWPCGVIGGCYVMWSSKDTVCHLLSTNKDGGSFKNKENSSILFPKGFEWQQMMIAETSDLYTSVGLARSPNSNASLFLPPPHKKLDKEKVREELFQLLLSLSLLESDVCVQLLTKRAKFLARQFMRKREVCYEELEDAYNIYHTERSKKASFTFDKLCLQALLGYSSMKSHRTLMFENGVLEALLSALKVHEGDRDFESIIAQIIANLAIEDKFANAFHVTGWIGILASLSKSPYIEVKLPASKALANLDKDDFQHSFYDNGVYLLHPEVRSSKEFSADVIFVHGLLGATFWTWRQHDSMKKFNNVHKKEANNLDLSKLIGHYSTSSFYTFCWPKDWLAVDFPDARFISVDYSTCISKWKASCPQMEERDSLDAKANDLIDKLLLSNIGNRPIVWVTHSMGEAAESEEKKMKSIAQRTIGVIFFSVPHKGSDLVNLFKTVPYILKPSIDIEHLQKGSAKLLSLHERFKNFVHQNNIAILSFGETKKSRWGLTLSMLVTEDSSDPDFGEFYPLPMDHLSTCKPESPDSEVYQRTVQFLRNCIPKSSDLFKRYSKLELETLNILCLIP